MRFLRYSGLSQSPCDQGTQSTCAKSESREELGSKERYSPQTPMGGDSKKKGLGDKGPPLGTRPLRSEPLTQLWETPLTTFIDGWSPSLPRDKYSQ